MKNIGKSIWLLSVSAALIAFCLFFLPISFRISDSRRMGVVNTRKDDGYGMDFQTVNEPITFYRRLLLLTGAWKSYGETIELTGQAGNNNRYLVADDGMDNESVLVAAGNETIKMMRKKDVPLFFGSETVIQIIGMDLFGIDYVCSAKALDRYTSRTLLMNTCSCWVIDCFTETDMIVLGEEGTDTKSYLLIDGDNGMLIGAHIESGQEDLFTEIERIAVHTEDFEILGMSYLHELSAERIRKANLLRIPRFKAPNVESARVFLMEDINTGDQFYFVIDGDSHTREFYFLPVY